MMVWLFSQRRAEIERVMCFSHIQQIFSFFIQTRPILAKTNITIMQIHGTKPMSDIMKSIVPAQECHIYSTAFAYRVCSTATLKTSQNTHTLALTARGNILTYLFQVALSNLSPSSKTKVKIIHFRTNKGPPSEPFTNKRSRCNRTCHAPTTNITTARAEPTQKRHTVLALSNLILHRGTYWHGPKPLLRTASV